MKNISDGAGYNERLFSGGFRKYLHLARFRWVMKYIDKHNINTNSVIELGCYDGKLLDHFSAYPNKYVGFDANWEGGLDIAFGKYKNKNISFHKAETPKDMDFLDGLFECGFCMETLEHIPPELVEPYLQKLSQHLKGYFFITVPNEKGILFLIKYIIKSLFSNDVQKYSLKEIYFATTGQLSKVVRYDHKGFDYMVLSEQLEKYFEIVEISGHPINFLPMSLCFGIGIVCKTKKLVKK